jgi:tetratricopeptide (TPR) repeat protein
MHPTRTGLLSLIPYAKLRSSVAMIVAANLLLMNFSEAAPYTPQEPSEVVASWQSFDDTQQNMSLDDIADFIEKGQYPGEADYRYGRAKAWLQTKMAHTRPDAQTFYLYARVLQHQHQFERALKALQRSIDLSPNMANAWLLKANIHLVQGDMDAARQACLTLIGKADMLLIATCALEVASQNGQLVESYRELARLYELYQFDNEQQKQWTVQILADMALRQGLAQQALAYLDQLEIKNGSLSLLTLWADVQFSLNNHQEVLDTLSAVVDAHTAQDDALLLRLAIAEKQLSGAKQWQAAFGQRVKLREQRQDSLHASELAQYFLNIDVQPEKALYWAKINWRVARQANDKTLLELAHQLLKSTDDAPKSALIDSSIYPNKLSG